MQLVAENFPSSDSELFIEAWHDGDAHHQPIVILLNFGL
jgi:hypothetical protein